MSTGGSLLRVRGSYEASKLRIRISDCTCGCGGRTGKLDTNFTNLHELAQMKELLYKEEVFQLVGFCMEIHRELGKGHDEVIYKDALVVELSRGQIPFIREKNYEVTYKGVILPHFYYADFVSSGIRFFSRAKQPKKLVMPRSNRC